VPEPAKEPAREEGTKRKAGLPGRVLEALVPGDPKSPEALSAELDAPVDQLLGALLELELEGRVRREPGPAFTRRA
jgi:predicted Rossmann fold nucleotide-binding protein DprA/Smf involved in DNA uptake